MMDGIKQQIHAKQQEAISTKHFHEQRKTNRKLREELNGLKDKNDSTLSMIKKDYDRSVLDEQNKLEIQLTKIRNKNSNIIESENDRYKQMSSEIKLSHEEKMAELKSAQESEFNNLTDKHQDALKDARDRYKAESAKYEA
jgi:hypothetical protein